MNDCRGFAVFRLGREFIADIVEDCVSVPGIRDFHNGIVIIGEGVQKRGCPAVLRKEFCTETVEKTAAEFEELPVFLLRVLIDFCNG